MIRAVVGELCEVDADALVRPATTTLAPIDASLALLERAAGPTFHQQLITSTELGIGSAIVTGGGDLPSEFVIHAVMRRAGHAIEPGVVRTAVQSCLQRAVDWQFRRVAFPPLAGARERLVMEATAESMAAVLIPHLKERSFPTDVLIVVDSDEDKHIFDALLSRPAR